MKKRALESENRLMQVATELHKLADAIGSGKIQIGGVDVTISDSVSLKIKQKMTGAKVFFDLKIQAPLALAETRTINKPNKKTKSSKKAIRPYGVKAQKKKYAGIWRVIASAIKKGQQPDDRAINDLEIVSKEYRESAPSEWLPLWKETEALVEKCITAVKMEDFATASDLLRTINRAKKSCHKTYK